MGGSSVHVHSLTMTDQEAARFSVKLAATKPNSGHAGHEQ